MASAKEPRSQVVDFTTPDAFESVLVKEKWVFSKFI